jgi:hypothetical protein
VNLKGCQVKEYYDIVNVVFIHSERLYGTVESLGLYASKIKYQKDGIEYEEVFDNEEFTVMEEIVFEHVEEEN